MKIVCCVEFYYPSIGGAQEVVRQLAERLVVRGHDVTVATSNISSRESGVSINGVNIVSFHVSGNQVRGFSGELERYRRFLVNLDADIIFFYAAQQWTFDAAWDVLPKIKAHKVFVPCGYSGLYLNEYVEYFEAMPHVLAEMDAVIYHARNYRDFEFALKHDIKNGFLIPNGADLEEFNAPLTPDFRDSLGINKDAILLLTVGSFTGLKGHFELTKAFALADFGEHQAVLILNGNDPLQSGRRYSYLQRFLGLIKGYGYVYAIRHLLKIGLLTLGWRGGNLNSIDTWTARINKEDYGDKKVLRVDLARDELVQAYLQSDLFVFASNIEYSPLVLFEACAAGLPFLAVPVGNSREIVEWTGGGVICEAPIDVEGYTRPDPELLAREIEKVLSDRDLLIELRAKGKDACQRRFNWDSLANEYEKLFRSLLERNKIFSDVTGSNK
jgi:glycosyltransferase involved in cell wall biosynthesis